MKTPKFENLKDEREFWDKQDSTDYLDDFEEAGNVVFARSIGITGTPYLIPSNWGIRSLGHLQP